VKRLSEGKSADARQTAQQDWTSCEHFSLARPLRYLTQQMRILTKNAAATLSITRPKQIIFKYTVFFGLFKMTNQYACIIFRWVIFRQAFELNQEQKH